MLNILRAFVLAKVVKTLPVGPHTEPKVFFINMIIVGELRSIMGMKMQYSSRTLSLLQENLRQADDKDGTLARSFKCRVNLTFTVFRLADCDTLQGLRAFDSIIELLP